MNIKELIPLIGTNREIEFYPYSGENKEWVVGKIVGIDLLQGLVKIITPTRNPLWHQFKFQLNPKSPVFYKIRFKN